MTAKATIPLASLHESHAAAEVNAKATIPLASRTAHLLRVGAGLLHRHDLRVLDTSWHGSQAAAEVKTRERRGRFTSCKQDGDSPAARGSRAPAQA